MQAYIQASPCELKISDLEPVDLTQFQRLSLRFLRREEIRPIERILSRLEGERSIVQEEIERLQNELQKQQLKLEELDLKFNANQVRLNQLLEP